MPTSYELNELATSGARPARMAATILSSLMFPTTLTSTFGCALSYSATTFLKTPSSRALQPTQIVSFVGELDLVVAAVAPTAASPRARSTSRATSALTRLIGCLPPGAIVKEPNQISLFWPIGGCQIRVLSLSGKYHFLDGSRAGRAAGD